MIKVNKVLFMLFVIWFCMFNNQLAFANSVQGGNNTLDITSLNNPIQSTSTWWHWNDSNTWVWWIIPSDNDNVIINWPISIYSWVKIQSLVINSNEPFAYRSRAKITITGDLINKWSIDNRRISYVVSWNIHNEWVITTNITVNATSPISITWNSSEGEISFINDTKIISDLSAAYIRLEWKKLYLDTTKNIEIGSLSWYGELLSFWFGTAKIPTFTNIAFSSWNDSDVLNIWIETVRVLNKIQWGQKMWNLIWKHMIIWKPGNDNEPGRLADYFQADKLTIDWLVKIYQSTYKWLLYVSTNGQIESLKSRVFNVEGQIINDGNIGSIYDSKIRISENIVNNNFWKWDLYIKTSSLISIEWNEIIWWIHLENDAKISSTTKLWWINVSGYNLYLDISKDIEVQSISWYGKVLALDANKTSWKLIIEAVSHQSFIEWTSLEFLIPTVYVSKELRWTYDNNNQLRFKRVVLIDSWNSYSPTRISKNIHADTVIAKGKLDVGDTVINWNLLVDASGYLVNKRYGSVLEVTGDIDNLWTLTYFSRLSDFQVVWYRNIRTKGTWLVETYVAIPKVPNASQYQIDVEHYLNDTTTENKYKINKSLFSCDKIHWKMRGIYSTWWNSGYSPLRHIEDTACYSQ